MDDKYITFKLTDWHEFCEAPRSLSRSDLKTFGTEKALRDSVVIRLKDAFASAALHTYANSISVSAMCIGMLAPEVSGRLQNIADYFHRQAIKADDMESRLPD